MKNLTILFLISFFSLQLSGQGFEWAKAIEVIDNSLAAGVSTPTDVEADASGNIYMAGMFSGVVDFGGGEVTSSGDFIPTLDGYICKFSPSGEFIWLEVLPSFLGGVDDIELDEEGNIYLLANFNEEITVAGQQVVAGVNDHGFIIAKLNADRELQWVSSVLQINTFDVVRGSSIELNSNEDLVVAGNFDAEVNIGGTILEAVNPGDGNHFLAVLGQADGDWNWVKRTSNLVPISAILDVATDAEGNIYATGATIGVSDFGGITVTSIDKQVFFLAKYDELGDLQWVNHSLGSTSTFDDEGTAVETDPASGDVYVTGTYGSTEFHIGGVILQEEDLCCGELFLARFDGSGALVWVKQSHGGSGNDNTTVDMARSSDGGALLTGYYGGSNGGDAIFGEGANEVTLSAGPANSVFVAKYESNGDCDWARGFHGNTATANARATTVADAGDGGPVVAGNFSENLIMESITLNSTPTILTPNMFVVKMNDAVSTFDRLASHFLNISLSPNPNGGLLLAAWEKPAAAGAFLQVSDQAGKILHSMSAEGLTSATLDLSNLENGIYSICLLAGEYKAVERFVLSR